MDKEFYDKYSEELGCKDCIYLDKCLTSEEPFYDRCKMYYYKEQNNNLTKERDDAKIQSKKISKEDLTDDELKLLTIAFKLVEDVVELQRADNYDVHWCNVLYSLQQKLGIWDILNEKYL